MTRCRGGVLPAVAGLLLAAGSGVAQEMVVAGGPTVTAENPAITEQIQRIDAIRADPEAAISELLERWAPDAGAAQLEAGLRAAGPGKLYLVSRAGSFSEVERILLGPNARAQSANPLSNGLGDTTQDLVFTAVTPCRIFDTRNIAGGAPITAGTSMEFYVYGPAGDIAPQGGSATGCPQPAGKGEPRAVHMNLTVVPAGAQGNVRVYPADVPTVTSSSVNFKLGTNIANALTVGTYYAIGPKEIEVFVAVSNAHVVGDVLGYYYDAAAPSFLAYLSANQTVPDGVETTVIFNSENHDTGADYNSGTGIFTVPETGLYSISCHLAYFSLPVPTSRVNIHLKRNAGDLGVTFGSNADETVLPRMLTGTWQLAAGDTVRCNAFLNSGGASGLVFGGQSTSFFSATRVR